MAITVNTGSASVSNTEYSLAYSANYTSASAQTSDGVLQVYVDFSNMVTGDQYQIKVYEQVAGGSGAAQRLVYSADVVGVQSEVFVTPALTVMYGWDATAKRIAGSDRTLWFSTRLIPVT